MTAVMTAAAPDIAWNNDPHRPFKPYGAADQLFRTQAREILIVGPAGTGKTRAVLEKLYLMAMRHAQCRILLVRATRASLNESVLVTLENKVLPAGSGLLSGAHRQTRTTYKLDNGSEIVVLGLDNVNRIMSAEYDAVGVFEATEVLEDDWEKLDTRCRNGRMGYHQLIADCNPGSPMHWLRRRADTGRMVELFSKFEDNPTITPEYLASLSRLTGHRRARLFEGKWAAPEGLVYPELMDCVVEPYTEIPDGRFIGGVDFGWNDPFVALGMVYDSDTDIIHIYYERYISKCPLTEHIKALQRFDRTTWYCDPSRPDSIRDLRIADIWVKAANNNILSGVDAVSARITSGRLKIGADCTALIAESQGYAYPEKHLAAGEKPAPGNDHAMDALRYGIMAIDQFRTQTRWDRETADANAGT